MHFSHDSTSANQDKDQKSLLISELDVIQKKTYLSKKQVALYFSKSKAWVSQKIKEGIIPFCPEFQTVARKDLDYLHENNLLNRLSRNT